MNRGRNNIILSHTRLLMNSDKNKTAHETLSTIHFKKSAYNKKQTFLEHNFIISWHLTTEVKTFAILFVCVFFC